MRRLVRIDLPQRLARRLPKVVTEILVAVGITLAFVGLRAAMTPVLGASVPFALAFLAVVLATLVGGWRSGAIALLLGQLLTWYFVVAPVYSFALPDTGSAYGLLLTTFSQAVILVALAAYQREVRAGEVERQRRINFLGHALREMDHRTKNNFQIVTSMLQLQANKSNQPEVRSALGEAAERLQAVAAVYDALTPSSQGLGTVRLQDQLEEICGQIRRGILPEGIALETELEPIVVPHETAVAVGIIVNELVTNACKHAFPDARGSIKVRAARDARGARVEVSDDGRGYATGESKSGLGTRLIGAFVQRLKGRSEVTSSATGTIHSILVPLAQ